MKLRSLNSLIFLSLFFCPLLGRAASFQLDPAHTQVGFKVSHLTISSVKGEFKKYEGGFDFDEKSKTLKDLLVKIDATSIDTNESDRDKHLRSPDFFNTEKFSEITFKINSPVKGIKAGKKVKVPGTLTLKGISKPVKLTVLYKGTVKDPWGNTKLGFEAHTEISRKDYGITWNKKLDSGGLVVGETVEIQIEGEAGLKD